MWIYLSQEKSKKYVYIQEEDEKTYADIFVTRNNIKIVGYICHKK